MYTKEEKAVYQKQYRAENSRRILALNKNWREANPEKYAASQKANHAKSRENLTNSYVSTQLSRLKGIHQTAAQLRQYPEIIDCYRAIMKLRRMCIIKNKQKL